VAIEIWRFVAMNKNLADQRTTPYIKTETRCRIKYHYAIINLIYWRMTAHIFVQIAGSFGELSKCTVKFLQER